MGNLTKTQLEDVRDDSVTAIRRQLQGVASHGDGEAFAREALLVHTRQIYQDFSRKAFRKGRLAHELGKWQ